MSTERHVCSFCLKNARQVKLLIVGPTINGIIACICNECVHDCDAIILEKLGKLIEPELEQEPKV